MTVEEGNYHAVWLIGEKNRHVGKFTFLNDTTIVIKEDIIPISAINNVKIIPSPFATLGQMIFYGGATLFVSGVGFVLYEIIANGGVFLSHLIPIAGTPFLVIGAYSALKKRKFSTEKGWSYSIYKPSVN